MANVHAPDCKSYVLKFARGSSFFVTFFMTRLTWSARGKLSPNLKSLETSSHGERRRAVIRNALDPITIRASLISLAQTDLWMNIYLNPC